MLFTVNLTHLVESISADVAELGSKIDNQRHHSSQLLLLLSSSLLSTRDRLDTLASLLLVHPRFFASYGPIRPLLIELVGRNLLKLSSSPSSSKFLLNALACLIHSTPQLESHCISLLSTHGDALVAGFSLLESSTTSVETLGLLRALYNLLRFNPHTFIPLITDWSPLYSLLAGNSSAGNSDQSSSLLFIRAYAAHILAWVTHMSDAQRQQFISSHVDTDACIEIIKSKLISATADSVTTTASNAASNVAGFSQEYLPILRLIEMEQDAYSGQASLYVSSSTTTCNDNEIVFNLTATDLCVYTVDMCGILLPMVPTKSLLLQQSHNHIISANTTSTTTTSLVHTPSTQQALQSVAMALSMKMPILLQGAPGVGKTSLVEEAHLICSRGQGPDLFKIHLGDQTDSKVLLGTYVATDTPGKFRWQSGILTTAVTSGRWLLVEDIDLAPAEVISALVPLLESRTLFIPARGEVVKAEPGFRLFATRSTSSSSSSSGSSSAVQGLSDGLWTRIHIPHPPRSDILCILQNGFPLLAPYAEALLDTFNGVSKAASTAAASRGSGGGTAGRVLTLRDLLKWCTRMCVKGGDGGFAQALNEASSVVTAVSSDAAEAISNSMEDSNTSKFSVLPLAVREIMFREAIDCFIGMVARDSARDILYAALGSALGVPEHRVQFYVNVFVPHLNALDDDPNVNGFSVGRIAIVHTKSSSSPPTSTIGHSQPFAIMSHSLRLLERLAACISLAEPILLVGETGTGKTTVVQHLATLMPNRPTLHVVNMSQQSDSSDLLGGFRPVDARFLVKPLKTEFDLLFKRTFSVKKNAAFIESVNRVYIKGNWKMLCSAFSNGLKMAEKVFEKRREQQLSSSSSNESLDQDASPPPPSSPSCRDAEEQAAPLSKRIKVHDAGLEEEWFQFKQQLDQLGAQLDSIDNKFLFSFVEGTLVKAVRNGDWVLLDEINLANPETLECLSGLLQGIDGSLLLMERGDTEPIQRHPDFRLLCCMNPANDAGKRDLPPGLRSRFSEFWVDSPDRDVNDLLVLIQRYIKDHLPPALEGQATVAAVAEFYQTAKQLALHDLVDGAGHRVHFSIRTLSRMLSYAVSIAPTYGLRRALYEGAVMTFLTQLNKDGQAKLSKVIETTVLKGIRNTAAFVRQTPKPPATNSASSTTSDLLDATKKMSLTDTHVLFHSFWLQRGSLELFDEEALSKYVLTPSVQGNLANLARAVMSHRYPVLIQGPTSAGKTSMIEYLAKRTGHRFVRINNHEHTDLQEYVGSYVTDDFGKLVFKEGILVEALRKGHWIVLDELNLAPSDVLEALNRLLDDNRELFIPETQQVVRPHPDFMLFATQNPPGLYGGRKVLSRAFRNRFLELHFDDIPQDELAMILEKRCRIAPSYSVRIVDVYKALQGARQKSRIFDGKHGYVTLRDLFRWAERRAVGYLELAQDGYMILGEKIRKPEDRLAVVDALESVMKIKLNIDQMYEDKFETIRRTVLNDDHEQAARGNTDSEQQHQQPEIIRLLQNVVWTKTMKRLFVLVSKCVEHKEPALLVGETGCGKTTVCQVLAAYLKRKLHIINAHQHSETSDFLGSQRPVRGKDLIEQELQRGLVHFIEKWLPSSHPPPTFVQLSNNPSAFWESMGAIVTATTDAGDRARIEAHVNSLKRLHQRCQSLFEWHDGPLVHALRNGEMFLLDEISLADDSVLERLNSVLEPHRLLVLAEKASGDQVAEEIIGAEEFSFLATMNPGGDFGKKELSPALRNRFTEIWAPQVSSDDDLTVIINNKITLMNYNPQKSDELIKWNTAQRLIEFIDWFALELKKPRDTIISLRDILAWISFMTTPSVLENVEMTLSFIHGGCLVLVDGIGVNPLLGLSGLNASEIMSLRERCKSALILISGVVDESSLPSSSQLHTSFEQFGIHPFFISQGPQPPKPVKFAFTAPTTIKNCMRVLRSMQLKKPVLLEGSPGVGKTSLIANLAAISGRNLVRINLSDQTDLSDLFGSDLPVEDGEDQLSIASGTSDGNATQSKISSGPEFAWRDGPFLQAMKTGDWVLLDELNLASQQVLEGLNACLDHRGVVYIPELDREFECSPEFRVFAAQNPQNQGGGRKGLPKSFVNRFTQVYVVSLEESDLKFIISTLHPLLAQELVDNLTVFINRMHYDIMVKGKFGWLGGPWEFNLRDILRWVELIEDELSLTPVTQVPLTHGGGVAFLYLAASRFVEMIFAQRMRSQHDRNCVYELFKEIFESSFDHSTAASLYSFEIRPQYNISETQITIGKVSLSRVTDSGNSSSAAGELEFLQDTLPYLQTLMYCVKRNWMALITGPPASGKTSLVRYLSKITGNHLEEFAMNGGVDTVELLGGFEQADLTRRKEQLVYAIQAGIDLVCRRVVIQHIKNSSMVEAARTLQAELVTIKFLPPSDPSVPTLMEALCGKLFNAYTVLEIQVKSSDIFSSHQVGILFNRFRDLQTSGSHGKFEWIDGTLIRAMEAGHWVLIDNVNFCSPSVLDRLNPLLEPNGSLMVNERGLVDGQVKIVHPHPNFRLFLSMDPRHGEISRAMRNRSIELSMDGFSCASSENYLQGQEAIGLNQLRILSSVGLHGTFIPSAVYRIHQAVKSLTKCAFDQGVKLNASDFVSDRDVLQLARTIAEKMQRGESWSTLLQSCVRDVYLFYARAEALVIADDNVSRKLAPNTKVAFDVIIREVEEIMGSVQRTLEKKSSFIKDCSLATLWPLKLTGELWCGDSRLASAVLIACTLDDCLMESPKRHSSAHYHLVSRCRNVFALTDESNWKMILIWLSHRLTRSSDLSVVCFESITLLLNSIVLEFGSENAGMRGSLWSSLLQKAASQDLIKDAVEVSARFYEVEFATKKSLVGVEDRGVSQMTNFQRSYAFSIGQLNDSQLQYDYIRWLYPLQQTFISAIKEWVHSTDVITKNPAELLLVMDVMDQVWKHCIEVVSDFSAVFVALKTLKKQLHKCVSLETILTNQESHTYVFIRLVDKAMDSFGVSSLSFSESMWKMRSLGSLRSLPLFRILEEFKDLDSKSRLCANSLLECLSSPLLDQDELIRSTFVDSVATLYYINECDDPLGNPLLRIVQEAFLTLRDRLSTHTSTIREKVQLLLLSEKLSSEDEIYHRVPLAESTSLVKRTMRLGLVPIFEKFVIQSQKDVLRLMSSLILLPSSEATGIKGLIKQLLPRLAFFSEICNALSFSRPLNGEPLKRLEWMLNDSSISVERLHSFVKTIYFDAILALNQNLWSPIGIDLQQKLLLRSRGTSSACVFDDIFDFARVFENQGHAENSNYMTSSSSSETLDSMFAVSAISSAENVPIYAINSKRAQLLQLDRFWDLQALRESEDDCDFNGLLSDFSLTMVLFDQILGSVDLHHLRPIVLQLVDLILSKPEPVPENHFATIPHLLSELDLRNTTPVIGSIVGLVSEACLAIAHSGSITLAKPFLAKVQVLLSLYFLNMYIPKAPLDPASFVKQKAVYISEKIRHSQIDLETASRREYFTTGNASNAQIEAYQSAIQVFETNLKKCSKKLSLRPENSQIAEIHKDMLQLVENIIPVNVIEGLVAQLTSWTNKKPDSTAELDHQLHIIQSTLSSFTEKMESNYPMYSDLLQPVFVVVYHLKNGLKMCHEPLSSSSSGIQLNSELVSFEGSESRTYFNDCKLETIYRCLDSLSSDQLKWESTVSILSRLDAASVLDSSNDIDLLSLAHPFFSSLVNIWSHSEAKKREHRLQEEELYKYKEQVSSMLTEEDIEENELKKQFPDYFQEFESLVQDSSDLNRPEAGNTSAPSTSASKDWFDISDESCHKVRMMHKRIIDSGITIHSSNDNESTSRSSLDIFEELWIGVIKSSFSTLHKNVQQQQQLGSTTDIGDVISQLGVKFMLTQARQALDRDNDTSSNNSRDFSQYDFYTDANVSQVKSALPMLELFDQRIGHLLDRWPEHSVLLNLSKVCSRIASFPASSPLPRFMTGIELLLQKCEDWEKYASSEVSLKSEMDRISDQIVKWRKLELQCWRELLGNEDRKYHVKSSKLWFHLYQIIVGACSSDSKLELSDEDILSSMDQICLSSDIGEFSGRLELLKSFSRHIDILTISGSRRRRSVRLRMEKLTNMIKNVAGYYGQFENAISLRKASMKKPIMKDLAEYVKIATWKDVNVFALKESATRSHHHLNKFLKKYREVLLTPIKDIISQFDVISPSKSLCDVPRVVASLLSTVTAAYASMGQTLAQVALTGNLTVPSTSRLASVETLLKRMDIMIKEASPAASWTVRVSTGMNDLSSTIVERVKSFHDVNSSLEAKSSLCKTQKQMRKKALVDLLKLLHSLGLSSSSKSSSSSSAVINCATFSEKFHEVKSSLDNSIVLSESSNTLKKGLSWLSSQLIRDSWTDCDGYFYRIMAKINHLRTRSFSPSNDLAEAEIRKSVGFAEQMMLLIQTQRQTSGGLIVQLAHMTTLYSQLMLAVTEVKSGESAGLLPGDVYISCLSQSRSRLTDLKTYLSKMRLLCNKDSNLEKLLVQDLVVLLDEILACISRHGKELYLDKLVYDNGVSPLVHSRCKDRLMELDQTLNSSVERLFAFCTQRGQVVKSRFSYILKNYWACFAISDLVRDLESESVVAAAAATLAAYISNTKEDKEFILSKVDSRVGQCIESILLGFQGLRRQKMYILGVGKSIDALSSRSGEEEDVGDGRDNEFGLSENDFKTTHDYLAGTGADMKPLDLSRIISSLSQVNGLFSKPTSPSNPQLLVGSLLYAAEKLLPLVHRFCRYLETHVVEMMAFHRASCKLEYILVSTFAEMMEKGFCLPQGSSDDQESDETEEAQGTGIGEGQGAKDVSDEIEDQEQVEGMKNEEQEPASNQPIPEEDNAIEMNDDFEGRLEDVKADKPDDENQDGEDDEEESKEFEEEQMGDLDSDQANVVDEAMWADEDDKDQDSSDDKKEKDSGVDSANDPNVETVAKDEGDEEDSSKDKKKEEDEKSSAKLESKDDEDQPPPPQEDEEEEEDVGDVNDQSQQEYEENHGIDVKKDERGQQQADEEEEEEQDMELPDEMDLDDTAKEGGMDESGNGQDSDADEEEGDRENEKADAEMPIDQQEENNDASDDEMADRFETSAPDQMDEGQQEPEDEAGEEDQPEVNKEEEEKEQPVNIDGQDQLDIDQPPPQPEDIHNETPENQDDLRSAKARDQQMGIQGQGGDPVEGQDELEENEVERQSGLDPNPCQNDTSLSENHQASTVSQQQKSPEDGANQQQRKPNDPNPRRSMGDALKKWLSRLKSLRDGSAADDDEDVSKEKRKDQQQDQGGEVNENMDYEFVKNEADSHDAQVLDVATEDQLKQGSVPENTSAVIDEDQQQQDQAAAPQSQQDEPRQDNEELEQSTGLLKKEKPLNLDKAGKEKEKEEDETNEKVENLEGDVDKDQPPDDKDEMNIDDDDSINYHGGLKFNDDDFMDEEEEKAEDPSAAADYMEMRQQLAHDNAGAHGGKDLDKLAAAQALWRSCCNSTRELSFDLCEQLRLILEPTLATKLKGDYRTGKRLNMRKVIPYIASQFKKDKIWMRRTKPSKRTYQIMLCIDDSKSMAESKSVQLAYESLALISKALAQLEAGDMSIISFGNSVNLIHPFDKPFTDDAGVDMIQKFSFDQDGTDVKKMMGQTLDILEQARSFSSGDSLWQLQIVISDGICQDHDRIRSLVRRAAEQQIMVVFIILDNRPNRKDSIMKMSSVSYGTDQKTGRPLLQMNKYMDTFPFDYFVTVQQIEDLPQTLAETLRQYFILIGNL